MAGTSRENFEVTNTVSVPSINFESVGTTAPSHAGPLKPGGVGLLAFMEPCGLCASFHKVIQVTG